MHWARIQAEARKTPMELAPRRDQRPSPRAETLRTMLTVAMVMPHLWLAPPAPPPQISAAEVVREMPLSVTVLVPSYSALMAEDCRAQQEAGWSVQCEGLVP